MDYLTIAKDYSKKRSIIPNDHNGYAYISCLIFNKSSKILLSKGINKYNIDGKFNTIHAEVDAIKKLKINYKRKKVNLLVFRTNKQGDSLLMAKPCIHCLQYIYKNIYKKGYRLHNIYYTDYKGIINKFKH
tara:strand:- start:1132 stop:1524 length:393 start_codon:yes stop_codon:yes gene_type:complete